MIAKIYRGTNEIGGTCLELTAKNGKRLWVDIGAPLEEVDPDISYVNNPVDALLISHPHQDHYGLMKNVGTKIPIYIGEISLDFINAVKLFTNELTFNGNFQLIKAWQSFEVLETFKVTPYLTDHSTPESFAFLIEADGCRVFYSGDFRATGRKKIVFDKLLEKPPKDIDYLFMEGTMIERSNHLYTTEKSVEDAFVEIFQKQKNVSFVISSAQNIDRFVSIYNACKKTEKTVVIDPYTAWLLDKLSKVSASIPVMGRAEIKVYYHPSQISIAKQFEEFYAKIQQNVIGNSVFNKPSDYVYFSRNVNPAFFNSLKSRGKVNVIYSQWEGYLKEEFKQYFTDNINKLKLDKKHVNYFSIHTSGHAVLSDLKKYAKAINAKNIIPIHTAVPEAFQKEFQKDGISTVKLWEDGKEYELTKVKGNMDETLKYFQLAKELNTAHRSTLKNQKLHFRGNFKSFSLISLAKETAEKGFSNLKTKEKAEIVLKSLNLSAPKRPTPEKELQAWIIDFTLNNVGKLPFDNLEFITSELVFLNQPKYGLVEPKKDIRNDLLAIDSENNLCIIELKSKRDNQVKKQAIEFEKVVVNEFDFFEALIKLYTGKMWNKKIRKIAVWPKSEGKPRKQEFVDVEEINYSVTEEGYRFT